MKILQSSRQDTKGLHIHLQAWEPESKPRAVVGLVHGLGEHVVRHAPLAAALVDDGCALMGFDLRGNGRSGGQRGHAPDYETLLDDIDALLHWIESRHPGVPIFLYGHSLGGGLVLNHALRRAPRIRGVIATSPWLRNVAPLTAMQKVLLRTVAPLVPTLTQKWGSPSALSRDPRVAEDFERDPLTHGLITVRMYTECSRAGEWALEHAAEFPVPVLLMHGTGDRLTSWSATREFAGRVGRLATFRKWDGHYHELQNETDGKRVIAVALRWIERQLLDGAASRRAAGQMGPGMRKSRPIRVRKTPR